MSYEPVVTSSNLVSSTREFVFFFFLSFRKLFINKTSDQPACYQTDALVSLFFALLTSHHPINPSIGKASDPPSPAARLLSFTPLRIEISTVSFPSHCSRPFFHHSLDHPPSLPPVTFHPSTFSAPAHTPSPLTPPADCHASSRYFFLAL